MKNIETDKLSKIELIKGIIRLTSYNNKLMKSRGCNDTQHCYSASTLRGKSHEYVEACFCHAWDWLREEIRYHHRNHIPLPFEFDTKALDDLHKDVHDEEEEAWQRYKNLLSTREAYLYEEICNHIKATGLFFDETKITIDDIEVKINSNENLNISLKKCFGGVINYYHKHSWTDADKEPVDEINFGTIGAFNLDSLRGRQQMFLMGIICSLRDKTIRKKIAEVMEELHSVDSDRYRINNRLNCKLVDGIDNIVSVPINKVVMGEIE